MNDLRENPYLALTPCCGQMVCLQCMRFDEQSNREMDGCEDCQRYLAGVRARRKKHLATYEHPVVDR